MADDLKGISISATQALVPAIVAVSQIVFQLRLN